ncbi:hypothetical protein MT487_01120 [Lachnospiraceae bacterium NSJ-171]|nr:hypothetical protein [Lachnospiraceae bacterium NSJ-171]
MDEKSPSETKLMPMNKNELSTTTSTPLEPYIEIDGGYAMCERCRAEITSKDAICPNCGQLIYWSWLNK